MRQVAIKVAFVEGVFKGFMVWEYDLLTINVSKDYASQIIKLVTFGP